MAESRTRLAILGAGDAPTADPVVPEPILSAARNFQPELWAVPGAVFPATPAAREACARAYLQAGRRAEKNGFDGLYINTVGDYGLAEIRRTCHIPVTGAGEGAIHAARQAGRRFAIVTIWPPSMRFIYDAVLAASNATQDCVAIHHLAADPDLATLGQPDNFVQRMQDCGMTSMAAIRAACRRSLDDEGAEVIILGCTCMYPVAPLLDAEGFPVIEPMLAGYQYLESLVGGEIELGSE